MSRRPESRAKYFVFQRNTRSRSKRQLQTYCIEGEHVTTEQIAERLGISKRAAQGRLTKAQQSDGPVTWAALATTDRLGRKRG